MVGHMGYGGFGGYGMGGVEIISFFFFLLLLALIWLVVSKALLNTRKYKMMKDFPPYAMRHGHHRHDCDCHKEGHKEHKLKKKHKEE